MDAQASLMKVSKSTLQTTSSWQRCSRATKTSHEHLEEHKQEPKLLTITLSIHGGPTLMGYSDGIWEPTQY